MESKNKTIVVNFLKELLDVYEFELYVANNSKNEEVFMLNDMQGANLGGIEQEEFSTLGDIIERMDAYHNDYIYRSLKERENEGEYIPKDDWDLTAKRYLESDIVAKILKEIYVKDYIEIINAKDETETKDMIEILDEEETFYKNICEKYVRGMPKEMLLENDNKILYIYIKNEYIKLKYKDKINIKNYKDYLDETFNVRKYNSYQNLYNSMIKHIIIHELFNDLAFFYKKGKWCFYLTFDEVKRLGYGFIVRNKFPLIEKYITYNDTDFYNFFSLEQLKSFEDSLHLYYKTNDIDINKLGELHSKSNKPFNSNIIFLSEGMISYEDFISDYKETPLTTYDICFSKVIEYFKENEIKDLMDYGSDKDEGLISISSLYKEILDKLSIKYDNVYTEDVSDGKYLTTITFESDSKIKIDTSAWNGINVVTENVKSIYENFKNLSKNLSRNQNKNNMEYEY